MKNIQDGFTSSNVDDYSIVLDPSTYMPGTANHELGHVADGIAGSIKYEAEPGVDYITNPYLRYLADPDNTYTTKELRDAGFHSAAKNKRYLLNPTESKSHMLTLKRALKDSNKRNAVYDEFCLRNDVPVGSDFIAEVQQYEKDVTSKR